MKLILMTNITNMRKFFILGAAFVVSLAMLLTACKKDEAKPDNNENNNNQETPGGGGNEGDDDTVTDYVDLGLPSGTMWKPANETGGRNGLYTFDEAVSAFGNKLATKEQLEELKDNCTWEWQNNGYKVTGTNGNSIVLPAAGIISCGGDVAGAVGSFGFYWSSTADTSDRAWSLNFNSTDMVLGNGNRCQGMSVRLVHK